MKNKNTKTETYYLQFTDEMDIRDIPVRRLAEVGTWARRSSRIYKGTSSHTEKELRDWLVGECGIRDSLFHLVNAEDALIVEP